MVHLAPAVFGIHAVLMMIDEFYFHNKRGLERWERRGHPLDTLTVVAPTAYLLYAPLASVSIFSAMALFSCLFVTKDEWVHAKHCPPGEHWLHSLLFLLHPLLFWMMWELKRSDQLEWIQFLLAGQISFLIFQVVRWKAWK